MLVSVLVDNARDREKLTAFFLLPILKRKLRLLRNQITVRYYDNLRALNPRAAFLNA